MFVDASAIVALMSGEREAERVSAALNAASRAITSPVAVLEAVLALGRADKFNSPVGQVEPLVMAFLDERGIALCDLPPAADLARYSTAAAGAYRRGRRGLNICDCLHYACAKYYDVPILATDDEFRATDLETMA
jgi:ribonuclease VapC